MLTGLVKFFNTEKGFGFIKPDSGDSDKDIFVHQSGVNGQIQDNDKVSFETETTPKGLAAINVSVIDD